MLLAAISSLVLAACAPAPAAPAPLTLERAIALALERNVDSVRSRLQVASAESGLESARSLILPRVDFNASIGRARSGGGEVTGSFVDPATGATVLLRSPTQVYSTYAAGLSIQQLLYDGGNWWNRLSASMKGLDAARESAREARLQTVYLVEQSFYDMVLAQHQLQVLTDAAARSRDQADATQRLLEAGRQSQADLFAARANRDSDELNRIAQQARVEFARQDLAVAIGAEPSEVVAVEEPAKLFDEVEAPLDAATAVSTALEGRPVIKAYSDAWESQRRLAAAASGGNWPSLWAVGDFTRQTRDLGTFTASPDKASTLSAGVVLSWNLFEGFGTRAAVSNAEVAARQAQNELANARRIVAAEVEKAIARLAVARQLVEVATRSEQNAREALRLARARQELGMGTQLEVRDAELKLTQAQLSRVGALVGGREAESALRRALGAETRANACGPGG